MTRRAVTNEALQLEHLVDELAGSRPQIGVDVFIAYGAVVIGRVSIGDRSSVWYCSVLRADSEEIRIGPDCNIQDGSVLHCDPGDPVVLGDRVTVGHRAIVHGAHIEPDVLIGMGAIVLNQAHVASGSFVAAGAVVTPGTIVPPGSLVAGVPARVRRPINDEERATIMTTPHEYVEKARLHHASARTRSQILSG